MQIDERVSVLNDRTPNTQGRYVLYWMQMTKRAHHNHALNFAIQKANELFTFQNLTLNLIAVFG